MAAYPPQDKEALAINPERGSGGTGARKALLERATKMVEAAKAADYKFMRPLRERVGETNHPNEGVLLHEAELFSRKKVPKTGDARRFMWAENELLNNGEAGRKAVMKMRSETGRDWAVSGGAPTIEVSHEGMEGGEAKGIEPVEKPDVAEEMAAAKERVAEEEVAKKPGEERKLTENERRAQEASERARAKLEAREKAAPSGVEGRVRPAEGEGRAEAPAPKAAVGFKVEARGRAKLDELKAKINEAKKKESSHLADMAEAPTETVKTQRFEGRGPVEVTPLRSTTAGEIVRKHLDLNKYSKELRPMISRLVDSVIRIAGDTPVHYLSGEETSKIHPSLRGSYDTHNDQIFLNADRLNHDTPLHELFHAATMKAIRENPRLGNLMDRLFGEMKDAYNRDTSPVPIETALKIEVAAFKNSNEFLTYLMTHEKVQNYFKGFKISDRLAKDIGIPLWRRSTLWNGLVDVIRQALKLEPRDTSAIEAAMAISDHLFMARDPRFAIEAATRLAEHDLPHAFDVVERDQEAFMRSPREQLSRVGDIDKSMMKEFTKDKLTNLGGAIMKGSAKLLSGTWLDDMHGHLFRDAKGAILQAINDARNKVSHQYSRLMSGDSDHINRGYMLDKLYASRMSDYGNLLGHVGALRYSRRSGCAQAKQSGQELCSGIRSVTRQGRCSSRFQRSFRSAMRPI